MALDNPVRFTDPDGMGVNSVHIDDEGTLIKQLGEIYKLHPNTIERIGQEIMGAPPVGDNFIDYLWNRRGMRDAGNEIKREGPRLAPTMPTQIDPISPGEFGL